ncbi:uncharacterized protein K460DRAFT_278007 [Cucurbitaria berberidis CBS 394.84]|uniref:5'-3' DNA helicase ZGRF1-like N-terminal domain-containing protein n=1 Tax=Cucurbitaria berberidis CBS 394.84 TaxID=1168544 RepID=A0A9P4LA04_9PLEO|nr:uncharacterized protein K460DRAFT_278007 [Cucurbitaria berberidis CBS 394.84]KAF1847580.1 hypothetical protein K460DRAFT_278007 [Cucurbitaria berberidis CBS 394.84]
MTTSLRGTPRPSAVPASQNTAPVAEFRCLFTHDVRRKQKRWQDGYLKFHTFNNRVMVYDQARNFLGDTYYKDSNELHEGDELNLDKGVMVEVAETMGVTQTDLTPLFEKKTKEPPARPNAASQTRPFQRPTSVAPSVAPQAASQLRHKSLNTLLGTPKGPIGKAVPMKSPYEARNENDRDKENEEAEERATKRQKTVHNAASWRASSPVHDESPVSKKDLPVYARPSTANNVRKPTKFIPPGANVIILDSEPEPTTAILSDVTLPSTPPRIVRSKPKPLSPAPPVAKPLRVPAKPPVQTPKVPRGKVPVPKVKALETPKQPEPPSSPPVSASNRLTNIEFAVQPVRKRQKELSPLASPPRNPKAKSLRLSTGVKRGTLLCQSLPQQAPRTSSEPRASGTTAKARKISQLPTTEPALALSHDDEPHSRASSMIAKAALPVKGKRKGSKTGEGMAPKRVRVSASPPQASLDVFDDPEIIHGILDQQLLVLSSPSHPQGFPSSPEFSSPKPKRTITTSIAGTKEAVQKRSGPTPHELQAAKPRSPSPKSTMRKSQPRKAAVERPHSIRNESLPPVPVFEFPIPPSRDVSPAYTEASDTRSRNSQSGATPPIPEVSAPVSRNETVPLPPHPLRAGKTGPLVSTSELAALLQKPKKTKQVVDDPIEEDVQDTNKSLHRNFRRVRSENDAPIPSTAQDWERRNLPKPAGDVTDIIDEPANVITAVSFMPPNKKNTGLSALIKKTDPRRKLQRAKSLIVETNVPPVEEVEIPSPVGDQDIGPWSTEAFDLFDWRPPNRE